MTLENIVRQNLTETPARYERHDLQVTDQASGWTMYLTADRRDAWTTVLWEMSLRRSAEMGAVAAWAEAIPEKVTGLLEPLCKIEIDAATNRALLRSGSPTIRDDKVSYYEVVLEGTSSAQVRRFQGSHQSGKRQQVAFALTNEVLAKFAADLTACA